jgi:TonB family protein
MNGLSSFPFETTEISFRKFMLLIFIIVAAIPSFGSDTIYLNSRFIPVNDLDSAIYYRITHRSDSVPAMVNQKTFTLDMKKVRDFDFLIKPIENQIPPQPDPSESLVQNDAFSMIIGNELWVHHGNFMMWWENGNMKRHDKYNDGKLVHGRIWNEDGTGAKYEPWFEDTMFPGGDSGLSNFLISTLKYPGKARRLGLQGVVVVSFVVEANGSVSNLQIRQSVDPLLDQEALRTVSRMPKWEPAKMGGIPVRTQFFLPVNFALH